MKTHLPTGLRKALIAAIFAVSSVAYNAQADTYDLNNKRTGEAPTYTTIGTFYGNETATGYTDLTISGTECTAGTVVIYAHDYDYVPLGSDNYDDNTGDKIKIELDSGSNGVYEFSSVRVYNDGDGSCPSHSADYDFGYGSHSDGNLTITGSAKVSVSHGVDADGALTVKNNGLLTGDTSVEAGSVSVLNGEIAVKSLFTDDGGIELDDHGVLKATNGNITSETGISVTEHSRISAENGNITASDGDITVSEYSQVSAANGTVKASGTVKADGTNSSVTAVDMKGTNLTADNGGHLEATNMEGDVTALNAGSVNATTITGDVLAEDDGSVVTATNIIGDVTAKDAGTVNATTITGSATADNATLNATTITDGAIATNNGILTATNISGGASTTTGGTIQTDKQITGSVSGSNGVIAATAGQGLTITDSLAADGDTLITGAGETVTIGTTGDGNISGDGNFIGSSADHSTVAASNIQVKGDISGDSNTLSATGTNLADGISAIAVGGDISGDSNKLTVTDEGDIVVGGDVAGDTNKLTIMGDGDISVLDDITGDSNSLTVEGDGSISVSDAVSGDGNTLSTEGEGDITVGVLGRQINTSVIGDKGAVGNKLTAADGDISIDTFSDNSSLTVTATEGTVTVQEDSKATLADSAISAKGDITIGETAVSTKTLKLTESTTVTSDEGSVIINQNSVTDASSIEATAGDVTLAGTTNTVQNNATVEAGETITITGTTNTIDASTLTAAGTSVVEGADALTITGDTTIDNAASVTATKGNITITGDTTIDNASELTAEEGDITIAGDTVIDAAAVVEASGSVDVTGATLIDDGASVTATTGDITITATGDSITIEDNATVEAGETITITGTTNTIDASTLTAAGMNVAEGEDAITITGTNTISSGATLTADNGDITLSDTTAITGTGTAVTATTGDITATGDTVTISDSAALEATAGGVTLSATTNTVENGASVDAGETITIEGTTNTIDASSVTATGTGVAEGEDALTITGTNTIKGGATVKAENGNITLSTATTIQDSNTKLTATTGDITATGVAATITDNAAVEATAGNVTLSATTNKVQNGASVTAADTISLENTTNVSGNATLTADTIDVAEGAVVNMGASSADALAGKLAGTGTINVGTDNLNLSYDDTAFAGTVNMSGNKKLTISAQGVGADAVINLTNGADMDVTADASLGHVTAGNGSEVRLNPGTPDGAATASTLEMSAGSTLHIDTTDGTVADALTITESVSIATPATVYVNGGAQDALSAIDGDTSVTIIKLADGAVNAGVSEDVKFDMDGTQRVLQDKNMSLVATEDGVQLVISDNFRGVEETAPNQTAVNDTMKALSAAADHELGVLAASASKLDNILDALDNTRSTATTVQALQSLSAAGNLVVPNMMMDTTRHHLSTLRSHMGTPSCTDTKEGAIKKGGNAWAIYTGGHDAINGDGATGDYTRTHQGALLGTDYSLNCKTSVGISLGYENSIVRMDSTKAESDTIFADLYATVKQGKLTHRFSAGVALYDIDTNRHVGIAAGDHSYTGNSTGSMDAVSWNLGYEISRDVKLSEVSTLTPFATVDVAIHQLDTLNESGQGDASVTTNYDDPVQLDVALGAAYTRTFRSFTADSSALTVSAALHGELSKHRPTADNHFAGAADGWKVRSSERTPLYGEIGASVVVPVRQTTSLIGGGNFEFSEDRVSVGGNIGVNVKF